MSTGHITSHINLRGAKRTMGMDNTHCATDASISSQKGLRKQRALDHSEKSTVEADIETDR